MTAGSMMANDGSEPEGGKTDHRATYDSFMSATKWGVTLISVVLIVLALFLA